MEEVARITHADTRKAVETSLRDAGVWEKLERAIEDLKARRRALGLPADGREGDYSPPLKGGAFRD